MHSLSSRCRFEKASFLAKKSKLTQRECARSISLILKSAGPTVLLPIDARPIVRERLRKRGKRLLNFSPLISRSIFQATTFFFSGTNPTTLEPKRQPFSIGIITPARSSLVQTAFNQFGKKPQDLQIQQKRSMSGKADVKDNAGIKEFNQRFLDCSARGDLDELKTLFGIVDVDVKSERGWTALMFAARNGHSAVISTLIEKGCDINSLNSSGQTAYDIAEFWNHTKAASVLSQHRTDVAFDQIHNYYSLNPLYRASDLRKDPEALQAARKNPASKFVVFANMKPFLISSEGPKTKYKFAVFSSDQLPASTLNKSKIIFLGLETWDPDSHAWFAADLGDEASDAVKKIYPDGHFTTPFPVTMQMDATHAGIFAEAHSILCWLDRYKFCPTCGSKQNVLEGGYKQKCVNTECESHKGVHNTCYPRVDPSLIMLVVSADNKRCLLGRQKRFPPKMYSCLAGFMEPGECIEDTCRREVEEESGVKVGRVEYHSSQPWPFPATLMLGCIAHARTEAIEVDKDELEEARWFPRAEVAQMLAQQHPDGLFIPPSQAIAHQLMKSWVTSTASNL